ncbi:MAG: hypothetical protein V4754_22230 [Pseudomonadota bacterium]
MLSRYTTTVRPAAYDIFNGDADGICALHQLRLEQPRQTELITGVKRDIALLRRVPCASTAALTVLDVSLDANATALRALLDGGASATYIDHHSAQQAFTHPRLDLLWDEAPNVCTSILVDRMLGGRQRRWAVVGAYGDNMDASARSLGAGAGLSAEQLKALEQLGRVLNYNAYGECVADLHLDPAALYRDISQYSDPFEFVAGSPHYARLRDGYHYDCTRMGELEPYWQGMGGVIYLLPNQPWARRISGVLANRLASGAERMSSCAVLTENASGAFLVSVRSGDAVQHSASDLCAQFGGGGRTGAGGINQLPGAELERFIAAFCRHFAIQTGARLRRTAQTAAHTAAHTS